MSSKLSSFFVFLLTLLFLCVSCKDEKQRIDETPSRTVLIYMVGDNNLSIFAPENRDSLMSGMKSFYSTANILVYIDNYDSAPTLWQLMKTKNNKVQMKSLKKYDEQNSLDTDVMSSIIREVFSEFKADEKYLLLWSHGSGWLPSENYNQQKAPIKRSFGIDTRPSLAYQEIWDLRATLERSGVHFNTIIFDACHMASVEVAYELKEVTDYLIASPTEIQGQGFPYCDLAPLFGKTQLSPQRICEAYMNFYDGSSSQKTGSISLISTSGLDELASCIFFLRRLYELDINRIYSTQQYGRNCTYLKKAFYDLKDLYAHIPLSTSDMTRLESALSRVVIFSYNTPYFADSDYEWSERIELKNCCGITIFVPELSDNAIYRNAYPMLRWYDAIY